MEGPNGFDIFAREFGYSEENERVLDETQNHKLERQWGVEIDTTNIPHMVKQIHKEFAAIHVDKIGNSNDLARFYKRIRNKQIHYATCLCGDDWNDKLDRLKNFAKRHEMTLQVWGMASVGCEHKAALAICRDIAQHRGLQFTIDSMSMIDYGYEEGEIDLVPFFEDAFDYLHEGHIYLQYRFALICE
jgi:hypothetical protein